MMNNRRDTEILRETVQRYLETVNQPIQDERRKLWSNHNDLIDVPPPIFVRFGLWDAWCREEFIFKKGFTRCEDLLFQNVERDLRMMLFQDEVGDDTILEPWISVRAVMKNNPDGLWGIQPKVEQISPSGGSIHYLPGMENWEQIKQLTRPWYVIDEEQTKEKVDRLQDAIGDLIEIDLIRSSPVQGNSSSLAEPLMQLRGMNQMMLDMYDDPEHLHEMLCIMRDGMLELFDDVKEKNGWSTTGVFNQEEEYCSDLPWPKPNDYRPMKELWAFFAAQEFTLVGPEMTEEFMLDYQKPLMEKFGLISYGCCEDLTEKIDSLRAIPNLRVISVCPAANVQKCAEQIGSDYAISYRPNPADMVCCGFDEKLIRKILHRDLTALRENNCPTHVNLKDISTVQGETQRLAKWTSIVRDVINQVW